MDSFRHRYTKRSISDELLYSLLSCSRAKILCSLYSETEKGITFTFYLDDKLRGIIEYRKLNLNKKTNALLKFLEDRARTIAELSDE